MNSEITTSSTRGGEMNGQPDKGGIRGNSLNDRAAANFAYLYRKLIRLKCGILKNIRGKRNRIFAEN